MSKLYMDLKSIMRSFQWLLTQPLYVKGLGERTPWSWSSNQLSHPTLSLQNLVLGPPFSGSILKVLISSQHLVFEISRIQCWDPIFRVKFGSSYVFINALVIYHWKELQEIFPTATRKLHESSRIERTSLESWSSDQLWTQPTLGFWNSRNQFWDPIFGVDLKVQMDS